MDLVHKEFQNDQDAIQAIESLKTKGVDEDNIYVITHDSDRTSRVADEADASTVDMSDQGLSTTVKNVFRSKGDELRAKFKELGFSQDEAENLEEKLDEGKVVVAVTDTNDNTIFQ
ncbi:general stress protein [Evansella clarkii]|jgi:ABC-type sugar transport system substrate-binding protein|uniref:general stress protein n=1 Tax=Evansella clarkii TaxID=79879 RepID=UPI0009960E95|nr:general stress protein [Evansella clarkii]